MTDETGNRVGVFLEIDEFNSLLEEVEDCIDVVEAESIIEQNQKTYTAEEVEKNIATDDILSRLASLYIIIF